MSAVLPALYKAATILGIRQSSEHGGTYLSVVSAGDGTVLAEVIARCLDLKAEFDKLPAGTVAIAPANYKFRFAGEVKTGPGRAFRYHIAPRKPDGIPIKGHLWLDSSTGREIMLVGFLKKAPLINGPVSVVRDTRLQEDGRPLLRITHLGFSVAGLGRAELEFVEYLAMPGQTAVPRTPDAALVPRMSSWAAVP